ncbi:MAG TPA: hypothetical protein GXZ47_08860 [Treponema sp.]|nr:hypothetical protein [Treponema sp.]
MKRFLALLTILALIITSSGLFAQNVRIDLRLNTEKADSSNYFNWVLGNDVTKDSFDTSTGASRSSSTATFDVVRYDSVTTKKATMPASFRGIVLFPVSSFQSIKDDGLTVTEGSNGLVIRYVHRGTAYQMTTDKKGNFNVRTDAKIARGIAENIGGNFVFKSQYTKAGTDGTNTSDLDWSKITLVSDEKDPAASRWYDGSVTIKYKKGVMTIKGVLKEGK